MSEDNASVHYTEYDTRLAAYAVIVDDREQVLLALWNEATEPLWTMPGGGVELEETVEQGAVREVREETGYDVAVVRLVGVYTDPAHTTFRYPDGNVVQYVSLLFECRVTGGRPRTQAAEVTDMQWFAADALPPDVLDDHRLRIADAFAGRAEVAVR